ncbi:uncharacterized protein ELE39_000593, partial [Cryptosporidium sp. chipmunk genotype I]|uniref:uncharacterized protein n=1 Tax=Cryptosporidium sp. chipmunk genotype I TaxID=1280935 RepID=UPI003519F222
MGRFLLTSTAVTLLSFWSFCAGIGLKSPSTSSGSSGPLVTVLDTKRSVEIVHSGAVKYSINPGYNGSILGGGELVVGNDLLLGLVEPEGQGLADSSKTGLRILESRGSEVQVGLFLGFPCLYENGDSGILGPGNTHITINNILTCIKLFRDHDIKHDDIRYLFWKMRDYSLQNLEMIKLHSSEIVVDSNAYLPIIFRGLLHVSAIFKYSKKYKNSSSSLLSALDSSLKGSLIVEIKPIYSDSELKLELNLNVGTSFTGSMSTLVKENTPFAIASIAKEGKTHMENIVAPCNGSIVWLSERWMQFGKSSGLNINQSNTGYYGNKDYMEENMLVIKCDSTPSYIVSATNFNIRYPKDILVSDRFGQVSEWLVKEYMRSNLNLIQVNSSNMPLSLRNSLISKIKAAKTMDELRSTLISSMKSYGLDLSLLPNIALPKSNEGEDEERPKEVILREEKVLMERLNDSKLLLRSKMAPKARMSSFERRVRSGSTPGNSYKYNIEKKSTEIYGDDQTTVPRWEGLAAAGWNNMRSDEKRINLKAANYSGKEIQIFGPRPWNMDFMSLDIVRVLSMYYYGDIRYLLSNEFLYLFRKFGESDSYNAYTSSLMRYSVEMFVIAGMFVSGEEGNETLLGTVTIEFMAELKNREPIQVNIFSMHTGVVKQVIATSTVACSLDPLVVISSVENEIHNANLYFSINSEQFDEDYIFSGPPGQRDYLTYPLSQNQKLLSKGNIQTRTDSKLDMLNRHTYLFPFQSKIGMPLHSGPKPNLFSLENENIENIKMLRQTLNKENREFLAERVKLIRDLQELFIPPASDDPIPIFVSSVLKKKVLKRLRKAKSKSIANKLVEVIRSKKESIDESFLGGFKTRLELSWMTNVQNLKRVPKKRAARVAKKLSLFEKLKLKRKVKTEKDLKKKSALIAKRVKMLKKISSQKRLSPSDRYPGDGGSITPSARTFPLERRPRGTSLQTRVNSAPSAISLTKIPFYLRQELIPSSVISREKPGSISVLKPKKKKPKQKAKHRPKRPLSPSKTSGIPTEFELVKSTIGPGFPFTSRFFLQRDFELERSSSIEDRSVQIVSDSEEEKFGYKHEDKSYSQVKSLLRLESLRIRNLRSECSTYQRNLNTALDLKNGILTDIMNSSLIGDVRSLLSDVVRLTNQYQECLKKLAGSILAIKGLEIQARSIKQNFSKKLDRIGRVRKNLHNKYKKCKSELNKVRKNFYSLVKSEVSARRTGRTMNSQDYQNLKEEFKKYLQLERRCQGIMANLRKEDMSISETKMNRYVMASGFESLVKRDLELFNKSLLYYKVTVMYMMIILSLEKLILSTYRTLFENSFSTLSTSVQQQQITESLSDYFKTQVNLERLKFEEKVVHCDNLVRAGLHSIVVAKELLLKATLLLEMFEINFESLDAGMASLLAILSLTTNNSSLTQVEVNLQLNSELLKKSQVVAKKQRNILTKLLGYTMMTRRLDLETSILENMRQLLESELNALNALASEEGEDNSLRVKEEARTLAYSAKLKKIAKKLLAKIKLLRLAASRLSEVNKFEEKREQFIEILNTMKRLNPGLNLDNFVTDTSDIQTSDVSREDSEPGNSENSIVSNTSEDNGRLLTSTVITRISNSLIMIDREMEEGLVANDGGLSGAGVRMIELTVELTNKLDELKRISSSRNNKGNLSEEMKLKEEISKLLKEAVELKRFFTQFTDASFKVFRRNVFFSWPKTRLRRRFLDADRRQKMEENRMRRMNKENARGGKYEIWSDPQHPQAESELKLLDEFGKEGEDIRGVDTSASSLDLNKEKEKAAKKEKNKKGKRPSRKSKSSKKGSKASEDKLLEKFGGDGEDIKGLETSASSLDLNKEKEKAAKKDKSRKGKRPSRKSKSSKKGSKASESELLEKFGGDGEDIKGLETSVSSLDLNKEKEKATEEEKAKEKGGGGTTAGELLTGGVEGSEKSDRASESKLLDELGGDGEDIKGLETSASSLDLNKEKEKATEEEKAKEKGTGGATTDIVGGGEEKGENIEGVQSSESIIDLVAKQVIEEMKEEHRSKRGKKTKVLNKRRVLDKLRSKMQSSQKDEQSSSYSDSSSGANHNKKIFGSRRHKKRGVDKRQPREDKATKSGLKGKKGGLGLRRKSESSGVQKPIPAPGTSPVPATPATPGIPISATSPVPGTPPTPGIPVSAPSP